MKIGFIGLGKLGLPCAEIVARKGHSVTGYDVDIVHSKHISRSATIKDCVTDKDIVFVAVPTPNFSKYDGSVPNAGTEPKDYDYGIVKSCLIEANRYMNADQILVLISTVLPGTTKRELGQLVNTASFIYNPYLISMESVSADMVNPEMVLIGTEYGERTAAVEKLVEFYQTVMEKDARYEIGTWEECETIKMFYNTYVTMKITMANMIQDVAVKQGNISVDFVTTALANSTEKITGPAYMKSGMGDGGCCRPRDNIVLRKLAKDLDLGYDLFDWMMLAREKQAENLAKELVRHAEHVGQQIYIHGKSYKRGIPYCEGSYSLLVGQYCDAMGYKPIYVDPLTKDACEESTGVILLAHGKEYCPITAGSIVIDPWRSYNNDAVRVIHYGNTRLLNV